MLTSTSFEVKVLHGNFSLAKVKVVLARLHCLGGGAIGGQRNDWRGGNKFVLGTVDS